MIDNWINALTNYGSSGDQRGIRQVLGEILVRLNEFSAIFKKGLRTPSPDNIQKLKSFLQDVQSGELDRLYSIVQNVQSSRTSIKHLLNAIQQAKFDASHLNLAQNTVNNPISTGFHDEANADGLERHLSSSVYNVSSPKDKTLRAIREILQNAVDATDPERHPDLLSREGYKPEIEITTDNHDSQDFIDLIVEDHGIGMNWDIISKKFFVTFETGKSADTGAAGGFGIAKAIIQDTPQHGWSLDTQGNHVGRFHKNVYFGIPKDSNYEPPKSSLKRNATGGATLSLFGLPYVDDWAIERLCSAYAINDRLTIKLNDRPISPRFKWNDLKMLGDGNIDFSGFFDSGLEQQIASSLEDKHKDSIKDSLSDVNDLTANSSTKVTFALRQARYGRLYVMINGQYQYDEDIYMPKFDVVCMLKTTARPGTDDYPLDPGRSYIRSPLKEHVNKVISSIKEFVTKISENKLLQAGIDLILANKSAAPMTTVDEKVKARNSRLADAVMLDLSRAVEQKKSGDFDAVNLEETLHQRLEELNQQHTDLATQNSEKVVHDIVKNLVDMVRNDSPIRPTDVELTIEGLNSSAAVMIQKNIVNRKWVDANLDVTSEMMIIWQKTMRIILDKLSSSSRYRSRLKSRPFVPGLIFSDECLGLYNPANPDLQQEHPSVSINPLIIASAVLPKEFYSEFSQQGSSYEQNVFVNEFNEDDESGPKSKIADTPTNRLVKVLYHIATHELCHLLFPDSWGDENFHKNITYIEILAHDCVNDIKDVVKPYMNILRQRSKRLINAFSKGQRNRNEQFELCNFYEYMLNRKVSKIVSKQKLENKNFDFKNWFKQCC